jgi:hypothetical protein
MWQRAFVLEYASKITAVDPSAAGRTADEMLGLIRGRPSDALADIFPARNLKTAHAFGRRLLPAGLPKTPPALSPVGFLMSLRLSVADSDPDY